MIVHPHLDADGAEAARLSQHSSRMCQKARHTDAGISSRGACIHRKGSNTDLGRAHRSLVVELTGDCFVGDLHVFYYEWNTHENFCVCFNALALALVLR